MPGARPSAHQVCAGINFERCDSGCRRPAPARKLPPDGVTVAVCASNLYSRRPAATRTVRTSRSSARAASRSPPPRSRLALRPRRSKSRAPVPVTTSARTKTSPRAVALARANASSNSGVMLLRSAGRFQRDDADAVVRLVLHCVAHARALARSLRRRRDRRARYGPNSLMMMTAIRFGRRSRRHRLPAAPRRPRRYVGNRVGPRAHDQSLAVAHIELRVTRGVLHFGGLP